MNRRVAGTVLLLAFMSVFAVAAEIYRETDASGRVIYSDRPTSTNARKLSIQSKATDPAVLEAEKARLAEREVQRQESRTKAAETAERSRDIQSQRAQNCEKARAYEQRVQAAHRLYEADENGDRRYFSAAEHDAALEKARTQIKEWCDN